MKTRQVITCMCITLLTFCTTSFGAEPTNRDPAIQYFAELVGVECTEEVIDELGLPKDQCDQRHLESIAQCKIIAATDLPPKLSQVELGRAMLRFSLCRGMLMQGESFDLVAWDPTITEMLNRTHQDD